MHMVLICSVSHSSQHFSFFDKIKVRIYRVVVSRAFNLSTWGDRGKKVSVNSEPASSTESVPRESGLHRGTLYWKTTHTHTKKLDRWSYQSCWTNKWLGVQRKRRGRLIFLGNKLNDFGTRQHYSTIVCIYIPPINSSLILAPTYWRLEVMSFR